MAKQGPFFEDKLISPLAIRFSGDRIKPVFQDGRDLEAALGEMSVIPCNIIAGNGQEYSRMILAPFPPIEIVRVKMKHRDDEAWLAMGGVNSRYRWVTLDNRRLCCLQRIAAAQLPAMCVTAVKAVCDWSTERGAARKLVSSPTTGLRVDVGNLNDPHMQVWDWMSDLRRRNFAPAIQRDIVTCVQGELECTHTALADAPIAMGGDDVSQEEQRLRSLGLDDSQIVDYVARFRHQQAQAMEHQIRVHQQAQLEHITYQRLWYENLAKKYYQQEGATSDQMRHQKQQGASPPLHTGISDASRVAGGGAIPSGAALAALAEMSATMALGDMQGVVSPATFFAPGLTPPQGPQSASVARLFELALAAEGGGASTEHVDLGSSCEARQTGGAPNEQGAQAGRALLDLVAGSKGAKGEASPRWRDAQGEAWMPKEAAWKESSSWDEAATWSGSHDGWSFGGSGGKGDWGTSWDPPDITFLAGEWWGRKGESYAVDPDTWMCYRFRDGGRAKFTLTWDAARGLIVWGSGTYFLDPEDYAHLKYAPEVVWYGLDDNAWNRSKFVWTR
mmetsp:Transcript_106938/g.300721  ORF Transcript_106938/g.300721 Transcript_106938/m.300721 type:complete len:560 (+) Transcript_106938:206-1885(+)